MTVLAVALKTLREAIRQPRNLALTLGLPVALMIIFGLAFGGTDEPTYKVAVVNQDDGHLGAEYVAGLDSLTYASGNALVTVTPVPDVDAARDGTKDRTHDLALVLPSTFTRDLTPRQQSGGGEEGLLSDGNAQPSEQPPKGAEVQVLGDPSSTSFATASRVVDAYTVAFGATVTGQPPAASTHTESLTSREFTRFDVIAPGLLIYALLSVAPQAASALARESELKTIDRLRMSPLATATLLGGVSLAQFILASVGLVLALAAAHALGFHNAGSYVDAYVIALGVALAVTGLGMILAAFTRTQQEAANLGVLVAVPGSFLSGAFFPVPGIRLFDWGDRTIELYDLLATRHAVDAMREVLTFGHGLNAVAGSLTALVGLAAAYFVAGVLLFRKNRLTAQ